MKRNWDTSYTVPFIQNEYNCKPTKIVLLKSNLWNLRKENLRIFSAATESTSINYQGPFHGVQIQGIDVGITKNDLVIGP